MPLQVLECPRATWTDAVANAVLNSRYNSALRYQSSLHRLAARTFCANSIVALRDLLAKAVTFSPQLILFRLASRIMRRMSVGTIERNIFTGLGRSIKFVW